MSFTKKKITIDLSTARIGRGELNQISGRRIIVTGASTTTANCDLAVLGDYTADPLNMILQAKINVGRGFDGFYITNPAQVGAWI